MNERACLSVGQDGVRVLLALCLILAAGRPLGMAQVLSGTVVDQQQRLVVGAEVECTCSRVKVVTYTDVVGKFYLARPPKTVRLCLLQVKHSGFQEFRQTIDRNTKELSIQLSLPVVKEVLDVSASTSASDPTDGLPLGSVSLSRAQLEKISNNSRDLIHYAKLMAGAGPGHDAIYVDGLPATTLPAAEMISEISVNSDPFSAEYADSNQNHIEITTGSPNRKLRFSLGGAGLGLGGGSALAPGLGSSQSWASPFLSGSIPHLPLTFSAHGNLASTHSDQLVQAVSPGVSSGLSTATRVQAGGSADSGALNLYYSPKATHHASFSYNESNTNGWNSGVGGTTLPQAGITNSLEAREIRTSLDETAEHWVWRSGLAFDSMRSTSMANSTDPGLEVPGYFEAGGAPTSNMQTSESSWIIKTALQSNEQKRYWVFGADFSRTISDSLELPNPHGQFTFASLGNYLSALSGGTTGTWLVARGQGKARHSSIASAPFVQAQIWHSGNSVLMGGVRADYQSNGGVSLSPRLSAVSLFRGFIFRVGAGVFVHNWQDSVFVKTMLNDGGNLREFLSSDVSLLNPPSPGARPGAAVIARVPRDFCRPKDLVFKTSLQRSLRHFSVGTEYSWTDGINLLGSRRLSLPNEWLDMLESNRSLQKHEIQGRAQYRWGKQDLLANYRWIHSEDDTDGPFSFPEYQYFFHSEWARSTGIPTHNTSLVGSFNLPRGISAALVGEWHSSSPFTILTGRDINGDGLFNDRGGRQRNSGNGPSYRSLDLNLHRTIDIARLWRAKNSIHTDCGLQVNNLLGNRNYIALGSVVGSPLFGRPLSAQPGRSLRLWFNLAR